MNNLVPRGTPQPVSASQALVLEGGTYPSEQAELESPGMKEGSRPDLNTKPHFLLTKAQTNVGCWSDQENEQQLDFVFLLFKVFIDSYGVD